MERSGRALRHSGHGVGTAPGWGTSSTRWWTTAITATAVMLMLAAGLSGCVAVDERRSVTPAPRCPMGHQDKRDCMPDSGRGLCTKANRSDC